MAVASAVTRGGHSWTFRVDGPATGGFAEEMTIETGFIFDCGIEPMLMVPEEVAVGDRVLLVRNDAADIQYAVLLETQRGSRLWTRVSRSIEGRQ